MTSTAPVLTVDEALSLIDAFDGPAVKFVLAVNEALLDPMGLNMALITDRVLAKGWEPAGSSEHAGYTMFRYRELD